jgi:hypothetical protein
VFYFAVLYGKKNLFLPERDTKIPPRFSKDHPAGYCAKLRKKPSGKSGGL